MLSHLTGTGNIKYKLINEEDKKMEENLQKIKQGRLSLKSLNFLKFL